MVAYVETLNGNVLFIELGVLPVNRTALCHVCDLKPSEPRSFSYHQSLKFSDKSSPSMSKTDFSMCFPRKKISSQVPIPDPPPTVPGPLAAPFGRRLPPGPPRPPRAARRLAGAGDVDGATGGGVPHWGRQAAPGGGGATGEGPWCHGGLFCDDLGLGVGISDENCEDCWFFVVFFVFVRWKLLVSAGLFATSRERRWLMQEKLVFDHSISKSSGYRAGLN